MTISGFYPYLGGNTPIAQITPFVYREGATLLAIMKSYESWLKEVVTALDGTLAERLTEFSELYNQAKTEIDQAKNGWQNKFDAFIANVTKELAGLNDQAVANLVGQSTSKLSVALTSFVETKLNPVNTKIADLNKTVADTRGISWTLDSRVNTTPPFLYFIYEIHVPRPTPGVVVKHIANDYEKTRQEGQELRPPQVGIFTHLRETGASLVANGSAWATTGSADGRMTGLQIKDGVFYQGFATSPKGRDAIGVDKNGVFHILRNGRDSIEKIKSMGITDTFTYGPPLTENGAKEDLTDITAEWSGFDEKRPRSFIGQKANGNVVVVQVVGDGPGRPGASPNDCANLAMSLGLKNSLLLDGGGSTQALAGGSEVVRSSDATPRVLPEVIAFAVPYATAAGSRPAWDKYEPINGATGELRLRTTTSGERRLLIRGSVSNVTAINTVVLQLPKQYWPDDWIYVTVPCIQGGLVTLATVVIKSNGDVQITRKDGQEWLASNRYDFNIDEVLN